MKHFFISISLLLMTVLSALAQEFPNFRINLTGGYTYFLQSDPNEGGSKIFIIDDAYNNYNNDLAWGLDAEGNAHYILNNSLGFGAKFRYMITDAPATDLLYDAGSEHYGVISMSEKNEILFFAPSFMYAQWLDTKGKLLATGALSVGYVYLESSGNVDKASAMFSGSNLGLQADLGVDYFLTRNISIGLSTGYFYSKIKEVNINLSENKTKLPENSQPNLSNIKLNLSLSLNF